jgi:hypothetical protein
VRSTATYAPAGGACEGKPTEWWFPEIGRDMKNHERQSILNLVDHAKRICKGCPVQYECLDYSLQFEPFGIWGGFDESERMRLGVKQGIVMKRTRAGQKLTTMLAIGRPRKDHDVPTHG